MGGPYDIIHTGPRTEDGKSKWCEVIFVAIYAPVARYGRLRPEASCGLCPTNKGNMVQKTPDTTCPGEDGAGAREAEPEEWSVSGDGGADCVPTGLRV